MYKISFRTPHLSTVQWPETHGLSTRTPSLSLRLHHHLSLLFVQLTLGLALLIFILKTMALKTGNEHYNQAARFWTKIFAVNFALGVVTGIPMEFQFGTNWSRFSKAAGGVIGQTLAMEGTLQLLPGKHLPRPADLRREDPQPRGSLVRCADGVARLLAQRVSHHRHQRVDAAPGGLHARTRTVRFY